MSHVYEESSKVYDILEEKETEGERKENTVPEEKSDGPSPDVMSGMKLIPMVNKEGPLSSELLMCATKQMASSKPSYESIIQPYMVR